MVNTVGRITRVVIASIAVAIVANCAPRRAAFDDERPRIFEKPGSNSGSLPTGGENPGNLYVKKKVLKIEPLPTVNSTGSLFNIDDERNYLFAARGPVTIGKYIDVTVASTRSSKDSAPNKSTGKNGNPTADDVSDEILKSVPELEPEAADLKPIQRFKMKIVHRYPNGDVLGMATRTSLSQEKQNEISVEGRIPYDRLVSGTPVTTDDLTDVTMTERVDSELLERKSAGWEDEYTLRMSGFSEAKSKVAARLDLQREQLKKVREEVKNRLVAMGKERQQSAAERNKLIAQADASKADVDRLTKLIAEKDDQIKKQQDLVAEKEKEILALKPSPEEPADEKK